MALLFIDSFDHYPTADLGLKWDNTNGFSITGSGRFGSGITHAGDSGTENMEKFLDSSISSFVCGFAWRGSDTVSKQIFRLLETATLHLDIITDTNGRLAVRRAGTTVLATGTTILSANTWYYIELKATIHDTTGIIELKLNGVSEIPSTTGLDTRNGGTGVINRFGVFGSGSFTSIFDDLYFCDQVDSGVSGRPNNDFLGDIRVQALLPNGNGNSSQMTGSDGNSTDNYLLVDDTSEDGDSTYVESATVGHKDTYAMTNLTPASGTVYGVQLGAFVRKTDAGSRSVKLVGRDSDGGTEVDSVDKPLGTTFTYIRDVRQQDEDAAAWTVAELNAHEFGVKVSA